MQQIELIPRKLTLVYFPFAGGGAAATIHMKTFNSRDRPESGCKGVITEEHTLENR